MNVFTIGTTDYNLVVEQKEQSFIYTLSYLDCVGKIHSIVFSDLSDYADFVSMLINKNGPLTLTLNFK